MAKAGQAHDQTMDEILASIRRMISDDGSAKASAPAENAGNVSPLFAVGGLSAPAIEATARGPETDPDGAVGLMEEPEAALTEFTGEPASNVVELAIAQAMEEARAEVEAEPVTIRVPDARDEPPSEAHTGGAQRPEPGTATLEMRASVQARIEARRAAREAATEPLLSPNANAAVSGSFEQLAASMFSGPGRTIDELAADLLRPMLRDWLDDNLPPMVERLVREEIERVSRGRR